MNQRVNYILKICLMLAGAWGVRLLVAAYTVKQGYADGGALLSLPILWGIVR